MGACGLYPDTLPDLPVRGVAKPLNWARRRDKSCDGVCHMVQR